ncbi:MAG: NUDIX domain-containing protein [Ruminococcaceae bacterium]|nr:NUDIX domain-containing protein [Oscillospiraceae bacterium]
MELMDLYDENRIPLGRTVERSADIGAGECRAVVHVAIFDAAGRLLIQRRSPQKFFWPNRWDLSAAGGVDAGETPRQAAERECLEELGYALDLTGVRPSFTVNFDGGFDDFFLVVRDVKESSLRLQASEVSEVRWAGLDEVLALEAAGQFVGYPESFLRFLFDMHRTFGFPNN